MENHNLCDKYSSVIKGKNIEVSFSVLQKDTVTISSLFKEIGEIFIAKRRENAYLLYDTNKPKNKDNILVCSLKENESIIITVDGENVALLTHDSHKFQEVKKFRIMNFEHANLFESMRVSLSINTVIIDPKGDYNV